MCHAELLFQRVGGTRSRRASIPFGHAKPVLLGVPWSNARHRVTPDIGHLG